MLQTDYERGTKDSDVLETAELDGATKERLLLLAGKGTVLAQRWRLYLDIVDNGLPFLPQTPNWHRLASFPNHQVFALDVVDVVVSKLKRFSANDVGDIDAMVQRGLVPHDAFVARFEDAVSYWAGDARASELPRYLRNLHSVESDSYLVQPTEVDLPNWV